jgi:ERCC4-type nuclease
MMAKDPMAASVSTPEGGKYESSEKIRKKDTEKLTRSEIINTFGEKLGQLLLDGGYSSLSSLFKVSDTELEEIPGIGEASVKKIREILTGRIDEAMPPKPAPPAAPAKRTASVRVQRIRDNRK